MGIKKESIINAILDAIQRAYEQRDNIELAEGTSELSDKEYIEEINRIDGKLEAFKEIKEYIVNLD